MNETRPGRPNCLPTIMLAAALLGASSGMVYGQHGQGGGGFHGGRGSHRGGAVHGNGGFHGGEHGGGYGWGGHGR